MYLIEVKPTERYSHIRWLLPRRMTALRFIIQAFIPLLVSVGAQAITFEAVLIQAYQYNAQLDAARAQLVAQEELIPQARAAFYPQISASAVEGLNRSRTNGEEAELPGLPSQSAREELRDHSLEANASLNLFAGGQDIANLGIAKAQVDIETGILLATIQMILAQAALAYSDIYYFGLQADVLAQQIEQLEALSQQQAFMLQRKNATTSDLAQVNSQLADTQAQYYATLGQQQVAIRQLTAIIGPFDEQVDRAPPAFILPDALAQALAEAEGNSPELMQAIGQLNAAKSNVNLQTGALLPSLDLTFSARRALSRSNRFQSQRSISNRRRDDYQVNLEASVPLFTGGFLRSQVRQAKAQRVNADYLLSDTRQQVTFNIAANWDEINATQLQVQANQQSVSAAELALTGLTRQFKDGTLSTQDLLNAQQLRYQAQFNEYTSEMTLFEAKVNLLSTMGALTPTVNAFIIEQ